MNTIRPSPLLGTLRAVLIAAVDRFNQSTDREGLLYPRHKDARQDTSEWAAASERAIAHRLAFYLEVELRRLEIVVDGGPLVVDCEYNRHLGVCKALKAKSELEGIVREARRKPIPSSDEDGWFVFSVAPDIVAHERRSDGANLLVVELKKATNTESPRYDDLKLTLFTTDEPEGYGYSFGASIVARDDVEPSKRRLEIVNEYPAANSRS